jgi:hypothetical protein
MPQIEVESYYLYLIRYPSNPGEYPRSITLASKNQDSAPVKMVFLAFFPPGDSTGEASAGYQVGDWMRVYVPLAEFDDYWRLLQTEKPVFFLWRLEDASTRVLTFWMSTSAEPPGEGTTDAT